ncbi:septation protein SepH [Millisia brevis]|uniref:septation protein SepH n=1 Tax=Millisia brevis TaxID=264148 RepID=UPI00082D177D|nr:septation protein SepH [Millisia brevis]
MRDIRVIGLASDRKHVVCSDPETGEKFRLVADDTLRAAARGDLARLGQIEIEMDAAMRPREIQARIRAGASVESIAAESGMPADKVERFAHPVLLERDRAAQLARAAHPVRANGPAVETLEEVVEAAFRERGHAPEGLTWDAWKDDDHWVTRLQWQAGASTISAHWRFAPDGHGGSVHPLDTAAGELIDPDTSHGLRAISAISYSEPESRVIEPRPEAPAPRRSETPAPRRSEAPAPRRTAAASPEPEVIAEVDEPQAEPVRDDRAATGTAGRDGSASRPNAAARPKPAPRNKRGKPAMPSWEDVLLGVRSAGQ